MTFDELETLLISLGFEKIDGAGSRIKFFNKEKDSLINLPKLEIYVLITEMCLPH
jgi:hypothetical protein